MVTCPADEDEDVAVWVVIVVTVVVVSVGAFSVVVGTKLEPVVSVSRLPKSSITDSSPV